MRGQTLVVLLLASMAALVAPAAPRGQRTDPPPVLQQPFRLRVDVVSVDALVTDKHGQPVTDLTAADFEVKERGKLQRIDTFKFVDADQAAAAAPTLTEIRSDQDITSQAARDDVRLFVVFLDDYHVLRSNSERVRAKIAQVIGTINPHDLVAIMYPLLPVQSLIFSHDRASQVLEIEHFIGRKYDYCPATEFERTHWCGDNEGRRMRVVLRALYELSEHLGTLGERRKTVLYVSEGLTAQMPPHTQAMCPPIPCGDPRYEPVVPPLPTRSDTLQPLYIQAALEQNVAVYTLDPRGTAYEDFHMLNDPREAALSRQIVATAQESLRNLAYQTGGRAMVNVTEFGDMLPQMVRDSSAYYLLGYTSNLGKHDGQFHELSVRVKRSGVEVRARPGYWAWDEAAIARAEAPKAAPLIPADVKAAVDSLAANRPDAALRTWIATTRGANGRTDVTLVWESPQSAANSVIDRATIKAVSGSGEVFVDTTSAADQGSGVRGGQITFAAAPGPLTLRIAGMSASGDQIDSERRELTVPDYTGTSTLLSTPLVFIARTARELQQIRDAAAPRPAASREFSRTDRLLVRVTAFGPAGRVPVVTMNLLSRNGAPLSELPAPTARAAGAFESEVGLASLSAGEFLIEVRASADADHAKALIPFRIGR